MSYFALVFGIVVAILVVILFKITSLEKSNWAYPALLATFPIFYWAFAVYGSDNTALISEIVIGMGFLITAYLAYRLGNLFGLFLLAVAYIGHAVYDTFHSLLFLNPGAPLWWPEFCGSVDVFIGIYLLFFAFSTRQRHVTTA